MPREAATAQRLPTRRGCTPLFEPRRGELLQPPYHASYAFLLVAVLRHFPEAHQEVAPPLSSVYSDDSNSGQRERLDLGIATRFPCRI
jgi:hypothetical protein